MKLGFLTGVLLFWSGLAQAYVISPTSIEVKFSYTAEFQTAEKLSAQKMASTHSEYLFGYMQSPELAVKFGINHRTPGFGAPAWPPVYQILSETASGDKRVIRYHVEGTMLLNKSAATTLLHRGTWEIMLPYDLDNYYDKHCVAEGEPNTEGGFSYFFDPYLPGCEALATSPLAADVLVKLSPAQPVNEDLPADLSSLRGDNGNGTLFQITTVTGFADKGGRNDDGRKSFAELNDWFESQGFEKSIVQKYKNRPIYQFDKDILTPDHKPVHIRVTRLLANTDIDGDLVTFSKFFKEAIQDADVIVYAGHSGSAFVLDAKDIEKHAGKLLFTRKKQQLYFFDACSGYSYYIPMFLNRKDPGTTNILSFGLTSQFGYEHAMHKAFYRYLLDFKQDRPSWYEMMTDMEKVLRGMTFMLNLEVL